MSIKNRAYIIPAIALFVLMELNWLNELGIIAPMLMCAWGFSLGMPRAVDKSVGTIVDDAQARGMSVVAAVIAVIGAVVSGFLVFNGHLMYIYPPLTPFFVVGAYIAARGYYARLWILTAIMTGAVMLAMVYEWAFFLPVSVLIAAVVSVFGRATFDSISILSLIKSAGLYWIFALFVGLFLLIFLTIGLGSTLTLCLMYFALVGGKRPDAPARQAHVGRGALTMLLLIIGACITPLRGYDETLICVFALMICFIYTMINDRVSPQNIGGAIYSAILPARAWLIKLGGLRR